MTTRRQALYENAMRNAAIAMRSYEYGWRIDRERYAKVAAALATDLVAARAALAALLDGTPHAGLNPRSARDVGALFYDYFGLPVKLRTPGGGRSASKAALALIEQCGEEPAASVARALRAIAILSKLQDTYIAALKGKDLIRPQAHVTAQLSGRWSYRDPALQTTPPKIKPMFVAHPGCTMVACDYSQAELRNMAQLSACSEMLEAYAQGADIHTRTAMAAFGVDAETVMANKGKYRNPAKVIILGYHYSLLDDESAAIGLHGQLLGKVPGITVASVLGVIKRMRSARPEVRTYKERTLASAQHCDYVEEPLSKRRRKFYGRVKDTDAFNFNCQAMTAGLVDRAIQNIDAEFRPGDGLHLQRHDELIVGTPDPVRVCELLWHHMRRTVDLAGAVCTYEIELSIGPRWGEGRATVAPRPRAGDYASVEAVCDVAHGRETAVVVGLADAVRWAHERAGIAR